MDELNKESVEDLLKLLEYDVKLLREHQKAGQEDRTLGLLNHMMTYLACRLDKRRGCNVWTPPEHWYVD